MSSSEIRQQVLVGAKRIVIKVGSQILTNASGGFDTRYMKRLAEQIAELIGQGCDVTLVSSGAVAMGRKILNLDKRPKDVGVLQAVASVGQTGLMNAWHEFFAEYGLNIAQMLLTRDDVEDRNRYLNIRNCLTELHEMRAVPIINENDTVSVAELRLGDNDVLAALVANALCADVLILLSVIDGLQDEKGEVLDVVEDVAAARSLIRSGKSEMGTGGMHTKLEAARMVTDAGEAAVIANGRAKDVIRRIMAGETVGTLFVPAQRRMAPRQRWIGQAVRPAGVIMVDEGAAMALIERNKSLLATGIIDVVGQYQKGDVVVIRDARGHELARGLTNYNSDETRAIMGKRTTQFEDILGRRAYDEVVHRDNMAITSTRTG
ncbi:MAG: glutamate 5-kinase [Planctomycetes bacterium]|nr:glutamate 5-kinase [Planctomycetota bacterium]